MKDGFTYQSLDYLIIEDEYYARQELKAIIAQLRPEYRCVGEAEGVAEAVKFLNAHEVDLIVADISVCDGYSTEVFRQTGCQTPVIITTGYEQYRDQVSHINVVDYLLKPVAPSVLEQSIIKFENKHLIYSPIKQSL